jgi:hypothetical protein
MPRGRAELEHDADPVLGVAHQHAVIVLGYLDAVTPTI